MSETKSPELKLEVNGRVFTDWTRAHVVRSLSEIAGGFDLEYDDEIRTKTILDNPGDRFHRPRDRGDLVGIPIPSLAKLYLDGELIMLGWIEDLDFDIDGDKVSARMTGRDLSGWLVDGSANPNGPAEYKGLTVTEITSRLCAPFEMPVRAEVDVGAPLREFGIELGETVMSAIDKAAKQRAVLVTSDGVGGLVLTRSGTRRAPAPLTLPGNVVAASVHLSIRERFADYYVKGQTRPNRGGRRAALDGSAPPGTARASDDEDTASHSRRAVASSPVDGAVSPSDVTAPQANAAQSQAASVISSGHAVDPLFRGLYRPRVFSIRTQSGGAPNQVLAEWRMRIARGRSTRNHFTVAGWRDGRDMRLWRPNEIITVQIGSNDPSDMLVAGVAYTQDDRSGSRTELEVVGREAYDLEPLPDQHRRHAAARGSNVGNTNTRSAG